MLDCDLKFTVSGEGSWFTSSGFDDEYYYDGDAMVSDDTGDGEQVCLQTIVESDSSETIKFYWKVSSEANYDYLKFYVDNTLKDQISGEVDWQPKSYDVSAGIHTLKWVYAKDSSGYSGDDCGWVDYVQWSGPSPQQDPANWQEISYKHDVYGRRSEKEVDGYSTRYVYDGPHVIAEYDGNNNLLRKYIYGPGIDQPVCMIEEAESETYYYHYDALGSVVALSDSSGDTVQTYEYSVYGQPAVEDADHPNPYMFAGRRFDMEIGLYYNRARYYNPFTGRFLQADPVGYEVDMNLYSYCSNNPVGLRDPSGRDPCDPCSAGTNDINEKPKVELPPGYDFEIDDQTDNYECVGYIVVPMRLNPGYVLLSYKASKGAFEMPKNLDLWLEGSGYNTYTKLSIRAIGVFTYPFVKTGVKYAIKISRRRYRAYLVFLKKTSNVWRWLTGERYKGQPIFVEVTGGDGYDNLIYNAYESEGQATEAAQEAMDWAIGYHKEWECIDPNEPVKAG